MRQYSQRWSDFFHDSHGNIVIAQFPNWPLLLAIFFFALQFVPYEPLKLVSAWGIRAALFYWALLEITDGASLFRRCLGLATGAWVLIGTLAAPTALLH